MRAVDADELIKELKKDGITSYGYVSVFGVPIIEDCVPVVRCKDCPLSRTDKDDDEDIYFCYFTPGRAHHSMDYCSEGARQKQMR